MGNSGEQVNDIGTEIRREHPSSAKTTAADLKEALSLAFQEFGRKRDAPIERIIESQIESVTSRTDKLGVTEASFFPRRFTLEAKMPDVEFNETGYVGLSVSVQEYPSERVCSFVFGKKRIAFDLL